MENSASVDHPHEDMSPEAVELRYRKTIEIEATQARLAWRLPFSVEAELRSCGNHGLYEALSRRDDTRGSFDAYAKVRIRGAIRNGARALWLTAHRASEALRAVDGRRVRGNDRDRADGDKWDRIADIYQEAMGGVVVSEAAESPEETILRKERQELVREAVAKLPPDSQELLRWTFVDEIESIEIAERLGGLHKSRVTRRRSTALAKLANDLRALKDEPPRGT